MAWPKPDTTTRTALQLKPVSAQRLRAYDRTLRDQVARWPGGQEQLDSFLDRVHYLPKRKVVTEKGRRSDSCKPVAEVAAPLVSTRYP